MIVYHGSNVKVENPKLNNNTRPLDFGKGFYVTENYEQAKAWAIKKADRFGGNSVITKYEINLENLRLKEFGHIDKEWLCICSNEGIVRLSYIKSEVI